VRGGTRARLNNVIVVVTTASVFLVIGFGFAFANKAEWSLFIPGNTVVAALVAGIFPIGLLGELVSIGTLLAFVIVCGGVLVLRYKRPNIARPFRTPLVPLVPILGILICGYMMTSVPAHTWIRLIVWMAIGVVIYFLYGIRHSRIGTGAVAGGGNDAIGR